MTTATATPTATGTTRTQTVPAIIESLIERASNAAYWEAWYAGKREGLREFSPQWDAAETLRREWTARREAFEQAVAIARGEL